MKYLEFELREEKNIVKNLQKIGNGKLIKLY